MKTEPPVKWLPDNVFLTGSGKELRTNDLIEFLYLSTWYERLWSWFKRYVLRRVPPEKQTMLVTDIDYATRTITIGRAK